MNEFVLMVVIYINSSGGGFQMLPMGDYPGKKLCEEYSVQIKKDLAEPGRTLRATCLPKSAMNSKTSAGPMKK
jgi:hypothetical protein